MLKAFALLSENTRPRSPGFTTEGNLAALLSYLYAHRTSGTQLYACTHASVTVHVDVLFWI